MAGLLLYLVSICSIDTCFQVSKAQAKVINVCAPARDNSMTKNMYSYKLIIKQKSTNKKVVVSIQNCIIT